MRVLVTGVAGFIGSNLARRLLADGAEVRGVDCLTDYYDISRKRANLDGLRGPRFEFRADDLRTADLDDLLADAEVVFHQAAQPGVRMSWAEGFDAYVAHNVLATQRLLEACRRHRPRRVVYASSSSVYGQVTGVTDERSSTRPFSPYGVTKLAAEQLCTAYADNFAVPTVALRYFTVYGPAQRPDMAIQRMIECALGGQAFPLFGDGRQVRDFTFVDDVVEANVLAATADIAPGLVCNVAGGATVSVEELLDRVAAVVGRAVPVIHQPGEPGDVTRTEARIDLAAESLGWRPQCALDVGLAAQLRWIRRGSTP